MGTLREYCAAPILARCPARRRASNSCASRFGRWRREHIGPAALFAFTRVFAKRLGTGRQPAGCVDGVLERAHDTLWQLWAQHGRAVSIVGWSLGGLYARELAKHSPDMVRLVITLGSPFTGHPRETNAWRLYELASGHRIDSHDFHGLLRSPPPVPTTSIWSRTDGVVSWQCSVETRRELAENIVVDSSHFGLGAHPASLYAIADRLAQPEGEWRPFHRRNWRQFVYCDPGKLIATRASRQPSTAVGG